jgi:site-specific recombinase XerD
MRENFIQELEVFQRFQEGPLSLPIRNFAFVHLEQGYSKHTITLKLHFIADFYDWLNEQDLGIKDVNERVINKFTEFQGREKSLRKGTGSGKNETIGC